MATQGPAMAPAAPQALWFELMQFYIREAWLLDQRQFKEWLDIFTDDVLYFMPRRKNVLRRELHREVTPLGDLAILEEDKRYLEMRVARLETGMAWAEDPPRRAQFSDTVEHVGRSLRIQVTQINRCGGPHREHAAGVAIDKAGGFVAAAGGDQCVGLSDALRDVG
jgi:hypothetical protein